MKREAFIDNAKVCFIFLVVFGHVIQPLTADSEMVQTLYHWIYFFHMPAFILLSGFFAKGSADKGYIAKLSRKLIIPYMIFHLFYTFYYLVIGVEGWQSTIINPQWSLWFLLSLFSWHLLLIVYKKIPAIPGILLAIAIGVLVGYFSDVGHTWSLSRTFVFFPFFLIGYWITKDKLMIVKRNAVKVLSVGMMIVVFIGLKLAPDFSTGWLLNSYSYHALNVPEMGGLIRLGVYAISLLMVFSVLAWIPTKEYRYTAIGEKTLYIYLLHGIFIHWFRQAELFEYNQLLDLIGLSVISAAIVLFLSSKPVVMLTQPVIELNASQFKAWLKSRPRTYRTSYQGKKYTKET